MYGMGGAAYDLLPYSKMRKTTTAASNHRLIGDTSATATIV